MKDYNIQVELFKGDDPIDLPEDYSGDNYDGAVYGVVLAFEKGQADKVVYYIEKNGELVDIITKSKDQFDVKEQAVEFNQLMETV